MRRVLTQLEYLSTRQRVTDARQAAADRETKRAESRRNRTAEAGETLGKSGKAITEGFSSPLTGFLGNVSKMAGRLDEARQHPTAPAGAGGAPAAAAAAAAGGGEGGGEKKDKKKDPPPSEAFTAAVRSMQSGDPTGRALAQQVQAVTRVQGAWESFKDRLTIVGVQIFAAIAPQLQTLMKAAEPLIGVLASGAAAFDRMSGPGKMIVTVLGGVVAVAGPLLVALGSVVSAIGAIGPAVAILTGPVGLVIAAFAAAAAIAYVIYRNWDSIKAAASAVAGALKAAWGAVADFFTTTIPAAFSAFVDWLVGWGRTLLAVGKAALDAYLAPYRMAAQLLGELFSRAFETISSLVQSWGARVRQLAAQAADALVAAWDAVKTFFTQTLPALLAQFAGVLQGWGAQLAAVATQVAGVFVAGWYVLRDFFTVTLPAAFETLVGWIAGWGQRLLAAAMVVVDAYIAYWRMLGDFFLVTLPQALAGFVDILLAWGASLVQAAAPIVQALVDGWHALVDFFTTTLPQAVSDGWNLFTGVLNQGVQTVLGWGAQLGQAVTGIVNDVVARFAEIGTFLTETLPGKLAQAVQVIVGWGASLLGAARGVVDQVTGVFQGIGTYLLNTLPNWLRTGAGNIIHALIDGLLAAAEHIPGVGHEIASRLAVYLQGHSPPKKGPLHTIDSGARAVIAAFGEGILSGAPMAARAAGVVAQTTSAVLTARSAAPARSTLAAGIGTMLGPSGSGKKVTPKGTPSAGSAAAGTTAAGGAPAKTDAFGRAMEMVSGKFGGIVSSLTPLGLFGTFLEGVMQGLSPLVDALKEPLKMVGQILGAALAPVLKAMFPIFKFTAIAATYLGQIVFTVAGGIAKFVGGLIAAVGKFISKIPFLGGVGKAIQHAGEGIQNVGKGMLDGAEQLKKGREQLQDMEFGDTAEKVKDVNEALTNVPSGYKIALARLKAAQPVAAPAPVTAGAYGTGAAGTAGVSDNSVTVNGNIVIQGADKDGRTLWEEIKQQMRRENLRQSGTTAGVAFA